MIPPEAGYHYFMAQNRVAADGASGRNVARIRTELPEAKRNSQSLKGQYYSHLHFQIAHPKALRRLDLLDTRSPPPPGRWTTSARTWTESPRDVPSCPTPPGDSTGSTGVLEWGIELEL